MKLTKRARIGLSRLRYWLAKPVSQAFYWLRTHTINRYHIVNLRNSKNGYSWGWIETDNAMLFACFNLLETFVEKELGISSVEQAVFTNDALRETDKEILALFHWWTVERPAELKKRATDYQWWNDGLHKWDDEHLMRLMKVRQYLWT
jgi:hypothetical protein